MQDITFGDVTVGPVAAMMKNFEKTAKETAEHLDNFTHQFPRPPAEYKINRAKNKKRKRKNGGPK